MTGEPPSDDWVEKWGVLIGRGLGYVAAIALIIYLVTTYL